MDNNLLVENPFYFGNKCTYDYDFLVVYFDFSIKKKGRGLSTKSRAPKRPILGLPNFEIDINIKEISGLF